MALQPTMSECAIAVHERYLLQVRHCQQQAARQARLIGDRAAPHVDAPADLIRGYAAICAQVGMSPPTLRRRLRRGDVPVYRVWSDAGPLVCCVRLADLPKLRRCRADRHHQS
jgi:hypothetical protein